MLGAGGSSRAVVFGLLERGFTRVHLANRTLARAEALAAEFGPNVHPLAWDGINDVLPRAKLLVNTTSLGMHGQPALEVDVARLPPTAVVADLVYVPLETPLLRRQGPRAEAPPTGSACCCIRRCAASNCGSASGRR